MKRGRGARKGGGAREAPTASKHVPAAALKPRPMAPPKPGLVKAQPPESNLDVFVHIQEAKDGRSIQLKAAWLVVVQIPCATRAEAEKIHKDFLRRMDKVGTQ